MMLNGPQAIDQTRPWYLITRYPEHSSPYFAELCAANHESRPPFCCSPELPSPENPQGVVNLHRLKRLYREEVRHSPQRLLSRLRLLKDAGFPIVWTLHNLYPIDGPPVSEPDRLATRAVLDLADVVLCHTRADANAISKRTSARVIVCGWGGLSKSENGSLAPGLGALMHHGERAGPVFLAFGNQSPYKESVRIATLFLQSMIEGILLVVGTCRDPEAKSQLRELAERSPERIRVWLDRVEPFLAHRLYAASSIALCHYATEGRFAFFRHVLYPSSVATAVSFGVPVLAPDLPSIREIVADQPAIFYQATDKAIISAFHRAAASFSGSPVRQPPERLEMPAQWRVVIAVYRQVSDIVWDQAR